jgi:hypothetical protein
MVKSHRYFKLLCLLGHRPGARVSYILTEIT